MTCSKIRGKLSNRGVCALFKWLKKPPWAEIHHLCYDSFSSSRVLIKLKNLCVLPHQSNLKSSIFKQPSLLKKVPVTAIKNKQLSRKNAFDILTTDRKRSKGSQI
jgi:hypothetical protein